MCYEALITINCERYSKKITDFILLLDKLNWKIHNDKGSVEYLPVGDNDAFAWQSEKLSIKEVFDIINQKQENNELVGIDLLYKGTECGMSLLARNTNDIMLDLDIERKILPDKTTDFAWYFQNIIVPLRANGCIIDQMTFKEYI